LLREKMILRGYESHYRDDGNAALLCWISLTPSQSVVEDASSYRLIWDLCFVVSGFWLKTQSNPLLYRCEAGWSFLFIANIWQPPFQPLPHLCGTGWSFLLIANIRQFFLCGHNYCLTRRGGKASSRSTYGQHTWIPNTL
jgi:hypothetical protein